MAALAENTIYQFASGVPRLQLFAKMRGDQAGTPTKIWQGAMCSVHSSGYVRPLDDTDGNFAGFAAGEEINADSDGDKAVLLIQQGIVGVHEDDVTGLSGQGAVGATVYAEDSGTFRNDNINAVEMGKVVGYRADDKHLLIHFQASAVRSI